MATEHIDRLDFFGDDLSDPLQQVLVRATVQGIDDEARQEKVVNGKPLAGDLFVQPIAVLAVNFRQQTQVVLLRDLA